MERLRIKKHTMLKLWLLSIALAALLLLPFSAQAVDGVIEINQARVVAAGGFPFVISQSGSYRLTGNLTVSATGSDGIEIAADNVTIDLNGFTITGPSEGSGRGIFSSDHTNVEIKNGTIRDFGYSGLYASRLASGYHRVINVRAVGNRYGIAVEGNAHLVRDCTASRNSSVGIYSGDGASIINNTSFDNGHSGISVGDGSTVTNNTSMRNAINGIKTGDGSTITNNTVAYNVRSGISAGWGSLVMNNSAFYNNTESNSYSAGIVVVYYCKVKDNTLDRNRLKGIRVAAWGNTIEENLVHFSPVGIEFENNGNFFANNRYNGTGTPWSNAVGQTDGGGNVSF